MHSILIAEGEVGGLGTYFNAHRSDNSLLVFAIPFVLIFWGSLGYVIKESGDAGNRYRPDQEVHGLTLWNSIDVLKNCN